MKMYQDLVVANVLDPVMGMIDQGTLYVTNEGKIKGKFTPKRHSPFITVAHPWDRNCSKWFKIYFQIYGFVPRGCHNCWKIVAKPRTLDELMQIHDLQKTLGLPAKAGMERRDYTEGIYSAFWYCPLKEGLEGARDLWQIIDGDLGNRGIETILKRGCTEMELRFGRSDEWEYTPSTRAREDMLDEVFVINSGNSTTFPIYYNRTKKRWIEWAYQHGDQTYLKYTDGELMYKSLVTYHDSKHEAPEVLDFTVDIEEEYLDDYTRSANRKRYSSGSISPLSVV